MKETSTRICPTCKSIIVYKTKGHRNDAEKHNRGCRKCQYKKCIFTPNTKCKICDKSIYRIPSRLKIGTHFCSYSCRNKYYSKENSFCWKGEEYPRKERGRVEDWERKRGKKLKAIDILGGKCNICGYNKCLDAIDFHHKNPLEKDNDLNGLWGRKWELIEREIKKCTILCSNCHREYHWKERQNE